MTPEVADSYGPSSYPYALGSLSSSRPASTESKATTTSACFFEVPHANQNDDLMVCLFIMGPNGAAAANALIPDVTPFSKLYATFTKRRNARQFIIWYERLFVGGENRLSYLTISLSSSTSSLLHQVVLELLCPSVLRLPFLTNGAPKLS